MKKSVNRAGGLLNKHTIPSSVFQQSFNSIADLVIKKPLLFLRLVSKHNQISCFNGIDDSYFINGHGNKLRNATEEYNQFIINEGLSISELDNFYEFSDYVIAKLDEYIENLPASKVCFISKKRVYYAACLLLCRRHLYSDFHRIAMSSKFMDQIVCKSITQLMDGESNVIYLNPGACLSGCCIEANILQAVDQQILALTGMSAFFISSSKVNA